jgi:hypothetical protein
VCKFLSLPKDSKALFRLYGITLDPPLFVVEPSTDHSGVAKKGIDSACGSTESLLMMDQSVDKRVNALIDAKIEPLLERLLNLERLLHNNKI